MGIDAFQYEELIDNVKTMVADDRYDELVPIYLAAAMEAILERRYPCEEGRTWDDTAGRYDMKACIIATQLINKRGAEGETRHAENGVQRVYSGADVPASMLRGIIPMASVPR